MTRMANIRRCSSVMRDRVVWMVGWPSSRRAEYSNSSARISPSSGNSAGIERRAVAVQFALQ